MITYDFQKWLNTKSQGTLITPDGEAGPATRQAIMDSFFNKDANGVDEEFVAQLADGLGCDYDQLNAVAITESGGSGYDGNGYPKMLFERHKFDKYTNGIYSVSSYSNPSYGGYNENSWDKLCEAACQDVDAAYKSASWGKFQVMGFWFCDLGYASPLEMAYSTVLGEAAHYYLFTGYIRIANLTKALQKVSSDPDDCRDFAEGYNGPNYAEGNYHVKIANNMP